VDVIPTVRFCPLPRGVGQAESLGTTRHSPDGTGTWDALEASVMWLSMSVTISSAVAICQRDPGVSCIQEALTLGGAGPGSSPTFTRRTPASPWIPVERRDHC
jgi:hypothetical protein